MSNTKEGGLLFSQSIEEMQRTRQEIRDKTPVNMYFFGCREAPGVNSNRHTLWSRDEEGCISEAEGPGSALDANPWGRKIDGRLCHDSHGKEGEAHIHVKRDRHGIWWTAVSFPDRSVNHKHGSNCTFLVNIRLDLLEFMELAESTFPEIWSRFNFSVREPV